MRDVTALGRRLSGVAILIVQLETTLFLWSSCWR